MSINSFCNLVTFWTRDLRESRDMTLFDNIFWKFLSGLTPPDLVPPVNDQFSMSVIFFGVKLMASIWNLQ